MTDGARPDAGNDGDRDHSTTVLALVGGTLFVLAVVTVGAAAATPATSDADRMSADIERTTTSTQTPTATPVRETTTATPTSTAPSTPTATRASPTGTSTATPTVSTTTATPTSSGGVTAGWWYEPLSPLVNETVHVSARGESGPGYSYEWDYDDDGSYELQGRSASFHFDTSGDHRVTLRATGPGGRSVTRTLTLTVRETREQTGGPASDGRTTFLYAPLSPQDAELVTLVALPSFPVDDVASYGWDFDGDGTVDETGRIVERPGRLNATVQVTLQVTRTDGTVETVVKQVPVAKPRQVGGSPTPTNSASATSPTVSATDPGVTSDSFPGFGAVLAVTAIVLVVAGTRRRQSE